MVFEEPVLDFECCMLESIDIVSVAFKLLPHTL
jgi:hypothetical protein